MRTEIGNALRSILLRFDEKTSNITIEMELIFFCKRHGYIVDARLHSTSGENGSKVRHFLIWFNSTDKAMQFAYDVQCFTYGYTGVMIDVTSVAGYVHQKTSSRAQSGRV
jgi:hypothetical protein